MSIIDTEELFLNEGLEGLISAKESITKEIEKQIHVYLTDKAIPINERLDFYKKHAGKAWVKHDVFLPDGLPTFDDLYKDWLYDGFYFHRHETVKFVRLIERIEEDAERWGPVNEQFLEELFESGLTSFEFDW